LLTFTVRGARAASMTAKPAQGRPRRFGAAVGLADYPAMLATLAWRERRSAVGPKGRPPQHERLAGTARRDALNRAGKPTLGGSRYAQ
jgi:hypothetical protein